MIRNQISTRSHFQHDFAVITTMTSDTLSGKLGRWVTGQWAHQAVGHWAVVASGGCGGHCWFTPLGEGLGGLSANGGIAAG